MRSVPLLDLKLEYEYMKKDIDAAIARCLEHQKWIFGPEVKQLEDAVAAYLGVKHCIGVSSGTEALVISLRALAIKLKGREYFEKTDEIITTPFTFTATGDAIVRSGATPVFVDIDPFTYNLDAEKLKTYVSSVPSRVVGIVPVHLYGQAGNMGSILRAARERNLFIVEDIAQAFGGAWDGKKCGALGTTGCFSFFPSKNLGGFGDGGMVSTNDDELDELIRMLVKHGGRDKYNVDHIGYNARLDTIQAAVLLSKLNYIDEFNKRRREIAAEYNDRLKNVQGIVVPSVQPGSEHVYHQYTVRVLNGKRDGLQKFLKGKGIDTMVYYPVPLHAMKVFEGRHKSAGRLEEAERAAKEVLSLPVEPLQDRQVSVFVSECIKEFCAG